MYKQSGTPKKIWTTYPITLNWPSQSEETRGVTDQYNSRELD